VSDAVYCAMAECSELLPNVLLRTRAMATQTHPHDTYYLHQPFPNPLFLSFPCFSPSLTIGGWGSIGSDFDRSPAIMLVLDAALDDATRLLRGTEGATNAEAEAAKAKVAVISNFMVSAESLVVGRSS